MLKISRSKYFIPFYKGGIKLCNLRYFCDELKERLYAKAILNQDVEDMLRKEGLSGRKHPGRRKLPCQSLPLDLENACYKIIQKYKGKQFSMDVYKMFNEHHHNQLPLEIDEITQKTHQLTRKELSKLLTPLDNLPEDEKIQTLEKVKNKVFHNIKKNISTWKSFDYSDYKATVYMAARLPANYAALMNVFNGIKLDIPSFRPTTLFDFGSGVGTTMWAANQVWPNSILEHFNVDLSPSMNDLSRLLLQLGEENAEMKYEGVFYKQFLPVSHKVKYDLVVCAFSLLEIDSTKSRIHVIENLWHKTQDILVFIEHGTLSGFKTIMEARNFILQLSGHKVSETFTVDSEMHELVPNHSAIKSHIVSPCPHEYSCPMMFTSEKIICFFEANYNHINFGIEHIHSKEKYCYVVLRKGQYKGQENPRWPRIVYPVVKSGKCTQARVCCCDGTIQDIRATKSKDSRNLYSCIKLSQHSDKLPVTIEYRKKYLYKDFKKVHEMQLLKSKTKESEEI